MAAAVVPVAVPVYKSPRIEEIRSSARALVFIRSSSFSHPSLRFPYLAAPGVTRNPSAIVACLPPSSPQPKTDTRPSAKLFVSGLSFRTTEEGLRNSFQKFGQLVEVNLVMDRIAKRPRGFAFLRYSTEEESKKAIEGMHGKFLDGRVIFVEVAKPRPETRKGFQENSRQY